MIILSEHDANPAGERSPLKSPASYPNVILSPVAEESPAAPPPPYGSTSAASARHALSPAARRDYNSYPYQYRNQTLQKLFRPAPYTRRTTERFLYAFFVAVLIVTVVITVTKDNSFEFIVNSKKVDIGLSSNDAAVQEIVPDASSISEVDVPTGRLLSIAYPPTRTHCIEEPIETASSETSALS